MKTKYFFLIIAGFLINQLVTQFAYAQQANSPSTGGGALLDRNVQLDKEDEVISSVFKDVVVVQRKAKQKEGKILFSTYSSFDFADGPITMYGFNTNVGYALSNFWEVYLSYTPVFSSQERPIVNKVRKLTLANNEEADITYSKPKSFIGLDLLWLPAYGKDSFGPYWIVRSDTFFKFGVGTINYESGDRGQKYSLMFGKTYFLSEYFNLRLTAGFNQIQTIVDDEKGFSTIAVLETGLVFYF